MIESVKISQATEFLTALVACREGIAWFQLASECVEYHCIAWCFLEDMNNHIIYLCLLCQASRNLLFVTSDLKSEHGSCRPMPTSSRQRAPSLLTREPAATRRCLTWCLLHGRFMPDLRIVTGRCMCCGGLVGCHPRGPMRPGECGQGSRAE